MVYDRMKTAMSKDPTKHNILPLSKFGLMQITRQRAKLERNLGSIADLTRLPAALFVVDISKEYIAVREASRLNIPVFAMVDTNSDPTAVDFPIPANDDASKSISLIVDEICMAIEEGLNERKMEREKEAASKEKEAEKKAETEEGMEPEEGDAVIDKLEKISEERKATEATTAEKASDEEAEVD
jgi:small subunit ribosomal protein S2